MNPIILYYRIVLNLHDLRSFLAAAEHRNFRRAARSVALSPSAFTASIQRLEAEVGTELFVRSTRSVRLSQGGERLLVPARRCLAEAERCIRTVRTLDTPAPFSLTLGTRYELGLSWLVPALARFERRVPERTLHLHFGDTPELLEKLRRGEVDAFVTSARLQASRLRLIPLHEEQYVFVATPALVERHALSCPADAAEHDLLDLHDDLPLFRYFRDARPAKESWRFQGVRYLGTIAAVRARVLEGTGVAVLPRYFVREDLRARRVRALLPRTKPLTDWFRLVWMEGHPSSAALEALAAELAAEPLR